MGNVSIRNLDDDVLNAYREAAEKNQRSLEAELRATLEKVKPFTAKQIEEKLERLRKVRELTNNPPGSIEAWKLIREDRDSR